MRTRPDIAQQGNRSDPPFIQRRGRLVGYPRYLGERVRAGHYVSRSNRLFGLMHWIPAKREALAVGDDVVGLGDLRLRGLDAHISQDRQERFAERLELLGRLPHIDNAELT